MSRLCFSNGELATKPSSQRKGHYQGVATTSLTSAVKTKYEALTAALFPSSSRPAIYFDEPPATDSAGAQVRPPYVVFSTQTQETKPLDFERNNLVTIRLILEAFATTLANVDTVVSAVRFNAALGAGVVGVGAGFDYGSLSDLTTPRSTLQIVPVGEPRRLADRLDKDGARVHAARMEWKLTVLELS